ncbi:hypothetical protein ACLB1O_11115 [Escherichia coli]
MCWHRRLHELTKRLIAGHFGEALTADAWRNNRQLSESSFQIIHLILTKD